MEYNASTGFLLREETVPTGITQSKRALTLTLHIFSLHIGHRFLTLVDKHFPKDHKLRKIFNRNTIKISQNCMNNTKKFFFSYRYFCVNEAQSAEEKKNYLWSQEHATPFPCEIRIKYVAKPVLGPVGSMFVVIDI